MPHLTPSDRIGTTVGGRYEVRRLLGEGGFSAVFESVHNITGRSVALKLLHPHLVTTEQITERFLLEARAMARIRHDGIVQVLDAGKDPDGTVYIALELLEGEALENTLQRTHTITWGEAARIGVDVLGALAEAHRNKIIHRDIKPGNIFIVRKSSGESQAKLLDFGIAHVAQAKGRFTQQGVILGTPEYMSPEQARSGVVGPEADIWSVGIVLYECILGSTPFVSENTTEILLKVQTDRAPELRSLLPTVPTAISDVVRRALEREVDDRYRSADEMREDLERAIVAATSEVGARSSSRSVLRGPTGRRVPAVTIADPAERAATPTPPEVARPPLVVAPPSATESTRPSLVLKAPEAPKARDEGVQVIRPGRLVVEEVVVSRRYDDDESRASRGSVLRGDSGATRSSPSATKSSSGQDVELALAGERFSLDDVVKSTPAPTSGSQALKAQPAPALSEPVSGVIDRRGARESGSDARASFPSLNDATASRPGGARVTPGPKPFEAPPETPRTGMYIGAGVAAVIVLAVVVSRLTRTGDPAVTPARDAASAASDSAAAAPPDASAAAPAPRLQLSVLHHVPPPAGVDASEFARHAAVSRGETVTTQRVIATCAQAGDGSPVLYFHPLLRGDALGSTRPAIACAGFDLGVVSDVTGDGTDDVIAVAAGHDALLLFNSASRQVSREFSLTGARGIAVGGGFIADGESFAVVYTEPGGDEQPGTVVALGLRSGRVRWRQSGRGALGRFGQPVELGLAVGNDLNRDGVSDIVVGLGTIIGRTSTEGARRCVQVLSGATGEPLWSPQCRGRGRGSQSVSIGPDVNGDGVPDVAVGVDRPERDDAAVELRSGTDGALIRAVTLPASVHAQGFGWPVVLLGASAVGRSPVLAVGSVGDANANVFLFDARTASLEGSSELAGVGAATLRLLPVAGNTPTAPYSLVVGTPRGGIMVYATSPVAESEP